MSHDQHDQWSVLFTLVATLLTTGHEIGLIVIYCELIKIRDENVQCEDVIFTVLPYALFVILAIWDCCVYHVGYEKHSCRKNIHVLFGVVTIGVVFFYALQVIVLLCKYVQLYLSFLPKVATCECFPNNDTILQSQGMDVLCKCYVPYTGQNVLSIPVSSPEAVNASLFKEFDLAYTGKVNVTTLRSAEESTIEEAFNVPFMKVMSILLQTSAILIMFRLPIYIQKEVISSREETDPTIRSYKKKLGRHAAVELCFYGFVESIDAFSLLGEILEHGDYFNADKHLTNSVLAFISITFIVVTMSNCLAFIPGENAAIIAATKAVLIFVSNFPFLVLRIYLSIKIGVITDKGLNSVFIMFTIKEGVLLVFGLIGIVVEYRTS